MQALVLTSHEAGLSYQTHPTPTLSHPEDVLIRLEAAALNHRDVWIRKGQYAGLKYPIVLGSDGTGVVTKIGGAVSKAWLGKSVLINPNTNWGENPAVQAKNYTILGLPNDGTFAEYVLVRADRLHLRPSFLSAEVAAALPLAGLTAFRALFGRSKLQKSEKILINGIGGGVALMALQFAVAAGAKVYVSSSSEEKIAQAIELGAIGGINYRTENWHKTLLKTHGEMNVIVDSAGGNGFAFLVDIAASGGRIVFYGGGEGAINNLNPQKIFWKQLAIFGSTMGNDAEFEAMLRFVEIHQLQPIIDSVFSLENGKNAFDKLEHAAQFGKIILKI